jgi:hypothetical protein
MLSRPPSLQTAQHEARALAAAKASKMVPKIIVAGSQVAGTRGRPLLSFVEACRIGEAARCSLLVARAARRRPLCLLARGRALLVPASCRYPHASRRDHMTERGGHCLLHARALTVPVRHAHAFSLMGRARDAASAAAPLSMPHSG